MAELLRSRTSRSLHGIRCQGIFCSLKVFTQLWSVNHHLTGLSLAGDLGEKVFLIWPTSPYFELREKFKCKEHIGKHKIWTKTSPWMSLNFSLSESSRLSPDHQLANEEYERYTLKILTIRTPQKFAVITLKFEQDGSRSSLIWVCTVCPDLSVRKVRIIMVAPELCFRYFRGR